MEKTVYGKWKGKRLIDDDWDDADHADAANAMSRSIQDETRKTATISNTFGTEPDSISPERTHTYTYRDKNIKPPSGLRAHPYMRTEVPRIAFYTRDNGEEYMKSDMKCDEGHIPKYEKDQLPFLSYSHNPQTACIHNSPNVFLAWNAAKSKYCCQSKPDSYETIMKRSWRNIQNTVKRSDVTYKLIPYLEEAIKKYLYYYDLVHPNNDKALIAEQEKMNKVISELETKLSTEREKKGYRYEQYDAKRNPLTAAEANEMFNLKYPDPVVVGSQALLGGRSKKHKSKSRTKKPKPKSRKPKSKSRKSKRRY